MIGKDKEESHINKIKSRTKLVLISILATLVISSQTVFADEIFLCQVDALEDAMTALVGLLVGGAIIAAIALTIADIFSPGEGDRSSQRNKVLLVGAGVPMALLLFEAFVEQLYDVEISCLTPFGN